MAGMDRNLRIRMLLEAGDKVSKPLRDIASGSTRVAGALKAARDRLSQLNQAQADLGAFRTLKAGIRTTETQLDSARARVSDLARQMDAAGTPTRKLARDFDNARRTAAALKTQHAQESTELQRLRDRMAAAGMGAGRLVEHERNLRRAVASTNTELAEQTRRLRTADDRARRFAAGRAKFAAVQGTATGLAAGGFSAIEAGRTIGTPVLGSIVAAQQYESAMTDIAQKANLARTEGAKMGAGLLEAARRANQLPEALQAGVDTLAGFGLTPADAVRMIAPIGRAATAYKAEIADLSAAGFAVVDNLKVPIDQTGRVIDVMAAAGKAGAFEMKDMAQYFPTLTAGYQALGQKGVGAVADLAAALQIARKGAGDSASAATNIANVLQKISSPATIKAFGKMGVDLPSALKKAYAESKTPLEAIAELTNKALGGDMSKLGYLFEDSQVQQGLRPLIANLEEYRRIRAEAANSNGTADRDFAERMQDSAERTRQLRVAATTLSISLGTALLPTVNAVLARAAAFAQTLTTWTSRHPMLARAIAISAAALSALFLVLGGGAILIAGLLAPFAALTAIAGAFEIAMLPLIGIVGGVALGIAALGAAAYLIYANWGGIGTFFSNLWAGVRNIFSGAWTDIKTAFAGGLWGVIALLWKWDSAIIGVMVSVGTSLIPALWGALSAGVSWAIGAVPSLLSGLMTGIKTVVWNGFLLIPRLAVQFGINTVRGFVTGMTSMLSLLKNSVSNMAQSTVDWFKQKLGIHSPSRVFMSLGGYMMQGLDTGIAGGQAEPVRRINDLSRTLTAALAAGAAATAPAAAAPARTAAAPAPAGAQFGDIHIHINQLPGQSAQDLAQTIRAELERLMRDNAAGRRSSMADRPDGADA